MTLQLFLTAPDGDVVHRVEGGDAREIPLNLEDEQLNTEIDPDNQLLPPSLRCANHTDKESTDQERYRATSSTPLSVIAVLSHL